MGLAAAVGPDDPDPLAEMDLVGEGLDEPGNAERPEVKDAPGRVGAAQADLDLLLGHGRRRRAGFLEAVPARFERVGPLGQVGRVAGSLLEDPHQLAEAFLLLVPAGDRVAELLLAILAGLRIGGVGAVVQPGAVALEGEDEVHARREQVAVV